MNSIGPGLRGERVTRLTAFAGLTTLAAARYAGTEARPPVVRVLALGAVAIVAAAALTLSGPGNRRRRRGHAATVARATMVALLLVVSLLCAGVPVRLLLPSGWPSLAHHLRGGLETVSTTLWPYTGRSLWVRVDILLALAVVPLAAAAVGCWPAARETRAAALRLRIRRVAAFALLTALYVIGVLDSNGGSAIVQGLAQLGLVVGWLWLPGLGGRRTLAAAGWLAACGAIAAGISVELAGSQSWFDYRAWNLLSVGQQSVAFSWDQTYGPIPWSRSRRTMFTVRGAPPGLWKVTTLDRFDGLRFVRSGTDGPAEQDLPLPLNDRWYEFARFRIAGLRSWLLPTEQGMTTAVTFAGQLRYEPDGTVRVGRPLRSGESYTVMSYVPRPTPTELRAAPRAFPAAYLRYTAFDLPAPGQSGLRLAATDPLQPGVFSTARTIRAPASGLSPAAVPRLARRIRESPYGPMYSLARRLATGAPSTYDVALRIENYLEANYAYTEQVPARRYPLEAFLFSDRIGYCQQFSGAMALMLRMDGIPARVAAGFLTGSQDSVGGVIQVRAVDAHSWVEVYFTGIGWVPFDPTPPRASAGSRDFPLFTQGSPAALQAIAATVGGAPQVARAHVTPVRRATRRIAGDGRTAMVAVALGGLLAVLALMARWAIGRTRLRRSLRGDGELAAQELVRALPMLGYALPATPTLAQIERLVRVHGGRDAAHYVRLLRDRRYAPRSSEAPTMRDRRRLRHGLTAHMGLDSRLRGQWALPPGTIVRQPRPAGAQKTTVRPTVRVARTPAPTPWRQRTAPLGRVPRTGHCRSRSPASRGS
jgi:transglutaminase-like putative cysteine protease